MRDRPMIVLGIETATERVSVAIGSHRGVLGLLEVAGGRRHAELLVPAIGDLCARTEIALEEVAVVAVDVGPGLFTGMRVGLAAAKAIAQARRIPMIGISSLDLVAFPLRHSTRRIAAIVDARKGEVFSAFYRQVPGGVQRLGEPTVGPLGDVVAEIVASGEDTVCVGDGAVRYADEILAEVHVEIVDQWQAWPSAAPLVQLAHARALREEWVNPREVQPLYLRQPDAQINWGTRRGMTRPDSSGGSSGLGPGGPGGSGPGGPGGPDGRGGPGGSGPGGPSARGGSGPAGSSRAGGPGGSGGWGPGGPGGLGGPGGPSSAGSTA